MENNASATVHEETILPVGYTFNTLVYSITVDIFTIEQRRVGRTAILALYLPPRLARYTWVCLRFHFYHYSH
jgi:hypothetical protein